MDGRDVELRETQSARHVHGGPHGLVGGVRIGAIVMGPRPVPASLSSADRSVSELALIKVRSLTR